MSSSLVTAIVVVVSVALTASLALKLNDSDGGAGPSSSSPSAPASVRTEVARMGVVAGCESSGAPTSSCECAADQIVAAGYDTIGEMADLRARAAQASRGDYSALPPAVAAAVARCAY